MLAGVWQDAAEIWMHIVDDEQMKVVQIFPYYQKKLLESTGLAAKNTGISLYAFTAWVQSTFFWGRGSKGNFVPYALGCNFQPCISRSQRKEAREEDYAIHVDEDASGGERTWRSQEI